MQRRRVASRRRDGDLEARARSSSATIADRRFASGGRGISGTSPSTRPPPTSARQRIGSGRDAGRRSPAPARPARRTQRDRPAAEVEAQAPRVADQRRHRRPAARRPAPRAVPGASLALAVLRLRISAVTAAAAAAASSQARSSALDRDPAPGAATSPTTSCPIRTGTAAAIASGSGARRDAGSRPAACSAQLRSASEAPVPRGHTTGVAERRDRDRHGAAERSCDRGGDPRRSSPATAPETIVSGDGRGAAGRRPPAFHRLVGCSQAAVRRASRRGELRRLHVPTVPAHHVPHAGDGAGSIRHRWPAWDTRPGTRATGRRTGTPRGRARRRRRSPCSPPTSARERTARRA